MFDAGALDDLIDEETRATVVGVAHAKQVDLVVPATVLTEFLLGHPRDRARADRVLNVLEEMAVTPAGARRAAWLLARAARARRQTPSVTDGTVAAFGEVYGAVATNDPDDLAALAAVGSGFDVYAVDELLAAMRREPR